MRLTNYHKSSLYNIIVNKLTDPSQELFKEIETKLQEWVFAVSDPSFKQFYDVYGTYLTDNIIIDIFKDNCSYSRTIRLFVPTYGFLTSNDYLGLGTNYTISSKFEENVKKYPELDWLLPKANEAIQLYVQFRKDLENLKYTINSCTTDKQLSNMYPDFVQFFNKAGITQKAVKQLPAVLGLPENLSKYGLKLTTKESIEENTRQEIKESENQE